MLYNLKEKDLNYYYARVTLTWKRATYVIPREFGLEINGINGLDLMDSWEYRDFLGSCTIHLYHVPWDLRDKLIRADAVFITLDGDVYDPSGPLSGGSAPNSTSILVQVHRRRIGSAETRCGCEDSTKRAADRDDWIKGIWALRFLSFFFCFACW